MPSEIEDERGDKDQSFVRSNFNGHVVVFRAGRHFLRHLSKGLSRLYFGGAQVGKQHALFINGKSGVVANVEIVARHEPMKQEPALPFPK